MSKDIGEYTMWTIGLLGFFVGVVFLTLILVDCHKQRQEERTERVMKNLEHKALIMERCTNPSIPNTATCILAGMSSEDVTLRYRR